MLAYKGISNCGMTFSMIEKIVPSRVTILFHLKINLN